MQKLVLMTLLIVGSASILVAQAQNDYAKNEFFAGYSFHSADINTLTIDPHRTSQNGFNFEYGRNLTRHIQLTVDASAHFKRSSQPIGDGIFHSQRDQYYLLGGIGYVARKEKGVTPFVHVLAGASLFRGFTSLSGPSGNVFTFDDATAYAMALGGGFDLIANERISLRLFQIDYAPTFFGSGRQDNVRLSFGVVFKK